MKAIVIGATGLVGKEILKYLLDELSISQVLVFGRRSVGIEHPKLKEEIVDFENMKEWSHKVRGSVLISAFGTTLRAAHSKDTMFHIDHDYQVGVATAAARNGVEAYVLISTINANSRSPFFYLKMKGAIEDRVKALPFQSITLLRPGPLKGPRERRRIGEILSTTMLDLVTKLVKINLEPVDASIVAAVAVKAGIEQHQGIHIIEPREILGSRR